MKRSVPRIGRVLDGLGVLLFLVGGGIYLRAWWGLRRVETNPDPPGESAGAFATVARVEDLHALSDAGLALMAAALVVGVTAAVAARWKSRDSADRA